MATFRSTACLDFCGLLTPNGCDCFGCCDFDSLNDPSLCKACTPVPAFENPCEACELCVGKSTLPSECTDQE